MKDKIIFCMLYNTVKNVHSMPLILALNIIVNATETCVTQLPSAQRSGTQAPVVIEGLCALQIWEIGRAVEG